MDEFEKEKMDTNASTAANVLIEAGVPLCEGTSPSQLWSTGYYPVALIVALDDISRMMLHGNPMETSQRSHWRVAKALLKNIGFAFATQAVIGCVAMDSDITGLVAIGLRDALLGAATSSVYVVKIGAPVPPPQRLNPFGETSITVETQLLCAVDKDVVAQRRKQVASLKNQDWKLLPAKEM